MDEFRLDLVARMPGGPAEPAPKYVPVEPGSTAQAERRHRRSPEAIAPRAIASYKSTERLPSSIDPGFLYRIDV